MTRWIILGGALLMAIGVTALALTRSAILDGFSGLVIWIFLGYCAIIVVAQVGDAVKELVNLAARRKEQYSGRALKGSEQ